MSFQDLVTASREYFPGLRIKYKEQSLIMKFLGTILFFNKDFMNDYTVSLYDTIYIPNHHFIKTRPVSAAVVFMYELVHMHSSRKKANLSCLYVIWKLSKKMNFHPHLEEEAKNFIKQLHRPWLPFSVLDKQFQEAIDKIKMGERPYEDPIFDVLDDLITKV